MTDLLKGLNPQQQKAVTASDGPVLVLAGPGSGKTRVLTHRVAWLVLERDVPPRQILAVTFTNKAAREMRERLQTLLGHGRAGELTLGTFHATCARILRRDGEAIGISRDYVIFDADDQEALVRQILRDLNIDDKKYRPASVHAAISRAKNDLVSPAAQQANSYFGEIVRRVSGPYQERLRASSALDFDDLLVETVRLFNEQPAVLARYQERYRHILVDEFQDTNTVQYVLLRQLAGLHHNLFCVADEDQCVIEGTRVLTASDPQPIESLSPQTQVRVAAGRGASMDTPHWERRSRQYEGPVVKITTQSGYSLTATPNHMMFARMGDAPNIFYVYLMHKRNAGYRIGQVQSTRRDGIHNVPITGLAVRGNQEKADKMWVLKVCASRAEATFWEQYFAFEYGIPTTVFFTVGRKMGMDQALIDELYARIDTTGRAERLMADLHISPGHPHHRPKGIAGNRQPERIAIQVRMFGDGRRTETSQWNAHRVYVNTSDPLLEQKMIERGYNPGPGRRGTWKLGWSNLDYGKALRLAEEISRIGGGLEIAASAFLTDTQTPGGITRKYDLHPASHIHPGMIVPVAVDGRIEDDTVVQVEWQEYSGAVYDINVDKVHTYIANGVVVHNSIYAWRGADYRNISRLREDHPELLTYLLEQNYRSTQTILDAARAVIRHNANRTEKKLFTDRGQGLKLFVHEAYDQEEEARFVVDTIAELTLTQKVRPGDCAVMYRTNAQSRAIEDAFVRAGLPYRLVGATRFYARREVKDLLAFMRLAQNPADNASLSRVLNVPPRAIGKQTAQALEDAARDREETLWWAVEAVAEGRRDVPSLGSRAQTAVTAFHRLVRGWHDAREEMNVGALMERILAETSYESYLRDGSDEGEDRWNNALELRAVAAGYADMTLTDFLSDVALVSDVDGLTEEANAPTLLTLHSAKGLEFPVVFITGLEDGLLPHSRSFDDAESLAEERRLMYVGVTRAQDRLYLTRAFRRARYGDYEPSAPSRFLDDIPAHLTEDSHAHNRQRATQQQTTWTAASPARRPAATRFHTGDRVVHPLFGAGIVLESKPARDEEQITVIFEKVGFKHILSSFLSHTKE